MRQSSGQKYARSVIKGPSHFYASPLSALALYRIVHTRLSNKRNNFTDRDYRKICFVAKNSSTCLLKVFRNRARGGVVGGGGAGVGKWEGGVVAYEYNCRFNWEVEGGIVAYEYNCIFN